MNNMIKTIQNIYKKYREIIQYLIVGGLTTLVSMASYILCSSGIGLSYQVATVISWIFAVSFAYLANKIVVFKSKSTSRKDVFLEAFDFFKFRIYSLIIEFGCMLLFVEIIKINDVIAKFMIQFIIVILNYFFSKFFIFKQKEEV